MFNIFNSNATRSSDDSRFGIIITLNIFWCNSKL